MASQTLENIKAVDDCISTSLFQPLISYDKQEIVNLAKQIHTYEHSIQNYKDCCSLISRKPRTKADIKKIRKMEEIIDIEDIVERTLRDMDVVDL